MEPLIPMVGVMALTALTPSFDPMSYDRETLVRSMVQAGIVAARAEGDVTYESLHFDKRVNTLTILGLEARPPAHTNAPDGCVFRLERASVRLDLTFDAATLRVEAREGVAAQACLAPHERDELPPPLVALGDDLMRATYAALDIRYGFARSTLDVTLEAEAPAVGRFDASARFDHMHVQRVRWDPLPAGNFLGAQATYAPSETAAALIPMAFEQLVSGAPVDALVDMALAQLDGGAAPGNKDEALLSASAKAYLPPLIADGAPITLVLAPRAPFALMDLYDMDGPRDVIPATRPRFLAGPPPARIVQVDLLAQALSGEQPLSNADRLTVGRALATGVGAPRSSQAAAEALAPMAAQGHAEAALLIAQALAERDPQRAYQAALTAATGGRIEAISLATTLEATLSFSDILEAQSAAIDAYGEARLDVSLDEAFANADPAALRRLAVAFAEGRSTPRAYEDAYATALIAAAAGDRPAALLIEDFEARFGADAGWPAFAAEAEQGALRLWTELGVGRRLGR